MNRDVAEVHKLHPKFKTSKDLIEDAWNTVAPYGHFNAKLDILHEQTETFTGTTVTAEDY